MADGAGLNIGGEVDEAAPFRHAHAFLGRHHDRNARKARAVLGLTAAMMVVEIGAGLFTHSMALLADGVHMATHAGVMLMAAAAYWLAERRQGDARFSFGVGKFGDLAAYSSAIVLALTAVGIFAEAVQRLLTATPVAFAEALPVAVLGLLVNLLSAWLLRDEPHDHGHGSPSSHDDKHRHEHDNDHVHRHDKGDTHDNHPHAHGHPEGRSHSHGAHGHEHDLNLRAAYLHVAADAAVSVLAIVALALAATLGWTWTDPVVGIVGAVVIGRWAWGLIKAAGATLVDMAPADGIVQTVAQRLQAGGERLADLHVWRVGPGAVSVIAAVVTRDPQAPQVYRDRLADLEQVRHVTIEVIARPA